MNSRRSPFPAALVLAAALFPQTARAGSACSISPLTLSFGVLDIFQLEGGAVPTRGSIRIDCPAGLPTDYVGFCPRFGDVERKLKSAKGHSIAYRLYHNAQMTEPWRGNLETIFRSEPYNRAAGVSGVEIVVYAQIPSLPAGLPADLYSDDSPGDVIVAVNAYDGAANVCQTAPAESLPFHIEANLQASCAISASDMNFVGVVSPTSFVTATANLTVTCTKDTFYDVGLSAGAGTTAARKMIGPDGGTIDYNLYRDFGHTLIWGDAEGSKLTGGHGSGAPQSLTVYGRVPPQPAPAAGRYRDQITVTLTY